MDTILDPANIAAAPVARHRTRPAPKIAPRTAPTFYQTEFASTGNPRDAVAFLLNTIRQSRARLTSGTDEARFEALNRSVAEFHERLFEIGLVYGDLYFREFMPQLKAGAWKVLGAIYDRTLRWGKGKIVDKNSRGLLRIGIRNQDGQYKASPRGVANFAGLGMSLNGIKGNLDFLAAERWIIRLEVPHAGSTINAFALALDWAGLLLCLRFWEDDFKDEERKRFIASVIRDRTVSERLLISTAEEMALR